MIRLYTDAAVKGNPGPAGVGILIVHSNRQTQLALPLNNQWNNHQAEFQSVIKALKWLVKNKYNNEMTFCYTDSQIVAQSVEKQYAKDTCFQKYVAEILDLMTHFSYISIEWIPESQNKGADNLARQALQKALKQT